MASTKRKRTPVSDVVVRKLLKKVLSGKIPPGERLPSERALAAELEVNRLTLRHALAQLTAKGLIEVRHGGGMRVLDWRLHASLDVLAELFGAMQRTPESVEFLAGLLELERITSSQLVALVAERRTDRELRAVETAIDALEALGEQPKQPTLSDIVPLERDIERAMVVASHNPAFALMQNAVYRFVDAFPSILEAGALAVEVRVAFYRQMADLIRAKDSSGARELALSALEMVHAQIVQLHADTLN